MLLKKKNQSGFLRALGGHLDLKYAQLTNEGKQDVSYTGIHLICTLKLLVYKLLTCSKILAKVNAVNVQTVSQF